MKQVQKFPVPSSRGGTGRHERAAAPRPPRRSGPRLCNKALARPAPSRHRSAPPSARAPGFPAGGPRPAPGPAPPAARRRAADGGAWGCLGPTGRPPPPEPPPARVGAPVAIFPELEGPWPFLSGLRRGARAAARAAPCQPESGHLARRRRALCQTRLCKVSADAARQYMKHRAGLATAENAFVLCRF